MIAMSRRPTLSLLAALALAATAAQSQAPVQPPADQLRKLCETISMNPADGREMARRGECVLRGALPSPDPVNEARGLAKAAVVAGESYGGLVLYMAYQIDLVNRYMHNGKLDADAYQRLAARDLQQRTDQIEALEGLGLAAGKSNNTAGALLAGYFHDTVAPRNVARTGAMAALLMRQGEKSPTVQRYAREADAVAKSTGNNTKASVRAFLETYPHAENAARSAYQAQSGGKSCAKPQLKSVSSGEIEGAEFLPLQGNLVKDSYLLKGKWTEFWTFQACGEEVPLKVAFTADGGGGATSTVRHNKGD